MTGGTVASYETGEILGRLDPVHFLGKAEAAQLSKNRTIILGGHGAIKITAFGQQMSKLDQRISDLENELMGEDLLLGEEAREDIMVRLAKLKGGLASITPGGRTEIEAQECRDRIEDAVCAARASIECGGFVVGGGSALLHASKKLTDLL